MKCSFTITKLNSNLEIFRDFRSRPPPWGWNEILQQSASLTAKSTLQMDWPFQIEGLHRDRYCDSTCEEVLGRICHGHQARQHAVTFPHRLLSTNLVNLTDVCPLFFWKKQGKPQKNKDFCIPTKPLKNPGKEGKNAPPKKEFLAREENKEYKRKQGKEGQGLDQKWVGVFWIRAPFKKVHFLRKY